MKRFVPSVLALTLSLPLVFAQTASATSAENLTAVNNAVTYMHSQQGSDGQIAGFAGVSDWAAMAYAAAGLDPASVKITGGTSLLDYLKANPPASGATATEYERDILAVVAAGADPYAFGGTNYVAGLRGFHTGGQIGSTTAVNDDFFAVAALVAARVPNTDSSLTDALSFTLSHQHADGGFSYTTDTATGSDVDDTAAALMALRAAQNAGLTVSSTAAANAQAYMLATQNADGGFPYDPTTPPAWGGPVSNVSTTSWVVMALTAFGNGSSTAAGNAQTYIRSAQQSDGSFPYTAPGSGDTFDTAYALMALGGGFWPLHIYAGALPETDSQDAVSSPSPSASAGPSASPSPKPSGSATPQSGSVLGASTTADPGSGSSSSGGGLLPAAGTAANLLMVLAALIASLAAGTVVYLRSRRRQSGPGNV